MQTIERFLAPEAQDFFSYRISIAAVTGSNVRFEGSFTVDQDSSFLWMHSLQFTPDAGASGAPLTVPLRQAADCVLNIRDNSTGRLLMAQDVPMMALFGNTAYPFVLPVPYLFTPGSTITVSVINKSTVVINTLQLAFNGVKLFNTAGHNGL